MKILLFAPFGQESLRELKEALPKNYTAQVYNEPQAFELLEVMDEFKPELVVMFWDGGNAELGRRMSTVCWDLIRILGRYDCTVWVVDDNPDEAEVYRGFCAKVFPEDMFTAEVFAALVKAASPVPA